MILLLYMISVNKKHHPPSIEDEVWRLEGIGKDGAYHKNLSSHGIKNVGAFVLKYQEIGPTALKKVAQENQNQTLFLSLSISVIQNQQNNILCSCLVSKFQRKHG